MAVDEQLVRRLLRDQLPRFASLPLRRVLPWGTDHGVWRLGNDHSVRLPRIHWATHQLDVEASWLPRLADHVEVALPVVVATGEPAHGYPYRWSVHRWVEGRAAGAVSDLDDPRRFAEDLADVVGQLQQAPTHGAPAAIGRARPLAAYDDETRRYVAAAGDLVDADAALGVWEDALAAPPHDGHPVWVQGDLAGNVIVHDGRLHGVVDWGGACAGDPAVDVQVAWSPLFTETSRDSFLAALRVDDATVRRSRGTAVHQACGALPYYLDTYPEIVERSRHTLRTLGVEVR